MDCILALHPAASGSIFVVLSGQRLDNVNRTHQVLASGKLVLQKHSAQDPWFACARLRKNDS